MLANTGGNWNWLDITNRDNQGRGLSSPTLHHKKTMKKIKKRDGGRKAMIADYSKPKEKEPEYLSKEYLMKKRKQNEAAMENINKGYKKMRKFAGEKIMEGIEEFKKLKKKHKRK